VPEPSTVDVDGCRLTYEDAGEGLPVVLIHGLGASRVLWADLRDPLGAGYRVVAFDLRGAGETRELTPRELSLATWAEDLRGLLDELGVTRPVLVGHSLGAAIALKFALEWPEDVRALVLMGPDANLSHLAPRMQAAVELIERVGFRAWVEGYWSHNTPFAPRSLEREPEILDRYREMLLRNDASDYVRSCRAIAAAEDLTGRLREVTEPALVIVGGADDRTLPEHGRALAERLGDGTLVELPGVGHTLPLEAAAEVAEAVRRFLGSVDGSGR
jgi:pimeloyl-ACP methyl ester carboxylesterase